MTFRTEPIRKEQDARFRPRFNKSDLSNFDEGRSYSKQSNLVKTELLILLDSINVKVPEFLLERRIKFDHFYLKALLRKGQQIEELFPESEQNKREEALTDRVITFPWNTWRFESIMEMKINGLISHLKKEPPKVTAIDLKNGERVYAVGTDGNHRTLAAKVRGIEKIPVDIEATVPKLSGTFKIDNTSLYSEYEVKLARLILNLKGLEYLDKGTSTDFLDYFYLSKPQARVACFPV